MGGFFKGETVPGIFYAYGGVGPPVLSPPVLIPISRGTGGPHRERVKIKGAVLGAGSRAAEIYNGPRYLYAGIVLFGGI